jgi:thiamine-phosphate pyrophosphorylase
LLAQPLLAVQRDNSGTRRATQKGTCFPRLSKTTEAAMFPALYAILDATPAQSTASLVLLANKILNAGVQLIQLRAKRLPPRQIHEIANALIAAAPANVRIIINDRPDLASIANAAGVHLGQEDLPVTAARQICPPPQWVGISTHNLEQLRAANHTSADYIAVGPIYPTTTKENPDPVVGLDLIRAARKLTRKPLVAIGGITLNSVPEVLGAGADSVAIISDLLNAPDPAQRAREYLSSAAQAIAARGGNGE